MRHETQVDLTEQLFAHLDAKTTAELDSVTVNPVTAYTCGERLGEGASAAAQRAYSDGAFLFAA